MANGFYYIQPCSGTYRLHRRCTWHNHYNMLHWLIRDRAVARTGPKGVLIEFEHFMRTSTEPRGKMSNSGTWGGPSPEPKGCLSPWEILDTFSVHWDILSNLTHLRIQNFLNISGSPEQHRLVAWNICLPPGAHAGTDKMQQILTLSQSVDTSYNTNHRCVSTG